MAKRGAPSPLAAEVTAPGRRASSVFSMKRNLAWWRWLVVWIAFAPGITGAAELKEQVWRVDGAERGALVARPGKSDGRSAPLVFVFHGHGGSSRQAARSFRLHELWPEARVVYPQGLPTPGALSDPEGRRAGWQVRAGEQGDRDLLFFDLMRASFADVEGVDATKVFATGHSNGGAFVYLLWAERHDALRAVAPSGAILAGREARLRPLPALHVAGMRDSLVKFAWQERMMDRILEVNRGGGRGPSVPGEAAYAPRGEGGAETVLFLCDDGHRLPREAGERIVAFFRRSG